MIRTCFSMHLWRGDDIDARHVLRAHPEIAVVSAAKEPWHRDAVGYNTPAAPRDSLERWWADRGLHTVLNLVDAKTQRAEFVVPILNHARSRIDEALSRGLDVLVHCNQGFSRSPNVVLWWAHARYPKATYDALLGELFPDSPALRARARESGLGTLLREEWNGRRAATYTATRAPTHTDLMVPPETIGPWLERNLPAKLPPKPPRKSTTKKPT